MTQSVSATSSHVSSPKPSSLPKSRILVAILCLSILLFESFLVLRIVLDDLRDDTEMFHGLMAFYGTFVLIALGLFLLTWLFWFIFRKNWLYWLALICTAITLTIIAVTYFTNGLLRAFIYGFLVVPLVGIIIGYHAEKQRKIRTV